MSGSTSGRYRPTAEAHDPVASQGNDSIGGIASRIGPLNPERLDNGRSFLAMAVALEDTTCVLVLQRDGLPVASVVQLLKTQVGGDS